MLEQCCPADSLHRNIVASQLLAHELLRYAQGFSHIFVLQEKMSTMEAEIADKDRQLTALREENSSLAGRNAVLEKVLALREEQLKQQQGGAADTNQVLVPGDLMRFHPALSFLSRVIALQRPKQGT